MQHLDGRLTVHEFAALRLRKTRGNMGRHRFALLRQPIHAVKLCAEDLERLIKHLAGVMINSGPECQIDGLLMFRFQFDGHGRFSVGCAVASPPCPLAFFRSIPILQHYILVVLQLLYYPVTLVSAVLTARFSHANALRISRLVHEGFFHRFRVSINNRQVGAQRIFD